MQPTGECSLYIHIPFCKRKCGYCNFYVTRDSQEGQNLFFEALHQEIQYKEPLFAGKKFISLYFGGGTPSLAASDNIKKVIDCLTLDADCEITLEANPENTTLPSMQAFRKAGINRVSLGIQSFDQEHLLALTRRHTPLMAEKAILATYEAGISNISIDLMYDLPHQTLKSWDESLIKASFLPVTHMSLYNLTIEPGAAFFRRPPPQPPEELSVELIQKASHFLEERGFLRYEISAFAKPGFASRHNLGYWTGRPFLGLGPSAFSYWEGVRFRNVAHLQEYARRLQEGVDPQDFSETLDSESRERELRVLRLRLKEGAPDHLDFAPLIERGFLAKKEGLTFLTEKGKLFYDTVAEELV